MRYTPERRRLVAMTALCALAAFCAGCGDARKLNAAIDDGDVAEVRRLAPLAKDINAPDSEGDIAIHRAAFGDSVEIVEIILAAGGDINAVNDSQLTPLHCAAMNRNVAVLKHIVNKVANVDAKDIMEMTALHWAVCEGSSTEAVDYLLAAGADPNALDYGAESPLHWSVIQSANVEIPKRLLEAGADIDAVSQKGTTPFMEAARVGNNPLVEFLLRHGANIDHRDNSRETAEEVAAAHGKVATVALIARLRDELTSSTTQREQPSLR